jgi:hypothetical protein
MTTSTYTRVIPRDLFNEAKLLKCLGQLALIAHDGHDGKRSVTSLRVDFDDDGGFIIDQRPEDGGLYATNLSVTIRGKTIEVYSAYNSKSAYPLLFSLRDEEGEVFNDDGTLADEFHDLIANQKGQA